MQALEDRFKYIFKEGTLIHLKIGLHCIDSEYLLMDDKQMLCFRKFALSPTRKLN